MDLENDGKCTCQSCGLPLRDPNVRGTNSDGGRNESYCYFCYRNGSFTMPGITMERMIDKVANMISMKKNLALAQSKQIAASTIPTLARWQSR
ncbi:MAG: transcriptional regulator [Firmicutes bacterium]|nr:transcriptional regulator [Bacillota bacterium]